jgi:hypothetical protein
VHIVYIKEEEQANLFLYFFLIFIVYFATILIIFGYCGGVPRGLLISVDFRGFLEVLS